MKKISILTGVLYCVFAAQTTLFSADSKPRRLPNRAPSGYFKPETGGSRAVGNGGCCRIMLSYCLKPRLVDTFVEDAIVLHTILNYLIRWAPSQVRELYLLCQNGLFLLSDRAAKKLNELGLLDDSGNIKEGWRDMILNMLRLPADTDIHPCVCYFQQAVIDLTNRFPEIIAELRTQLDAEELSIAPEILTILHSGYKLIYSENRITTDEIDKILRTLDSGDVIYRDASTGTTLMKELTLAPLEDFLASAHTNSVSNRSVIMPVEKVSKVFMTTLIL